MQITKDDYNDLLAEIIKTLPTPLQPDEITSRMLSESSGYSLYGARQRLIKLEREGKLTKRDALYNGKIVSAYRKVE